MGGKRKFSNAKEDIVCSMYLSGATTQQIADIFLCSRATIANILERHSINRRSPGGRHANIPIKIEGELFEIIEGHLLGDGCITKPESAKNYHFNLITIHHNYAIKVCEDLKILKPIIYKVKNEIKYQVNTKSLISPEYRKRWYPNNKKIIPKNLKLTPIVCLYWFLDDGGADVSGGIFLNTQSFTEKDLKKVILPQLKRILDCKIEEIRIYMCKSLNYLPKMFIPHRFVQKFLEYIGPSPVSVFDYKYKFKLYKRKYKKWSEKELDFLKKNIKKPEKFLMKKLDRSRGSISKRKERLGNII